MVAVVFDALSSDRSYHHATSYEETCRMIKEESGTHFDPAAVEAVLGIPPSDIEAIRLRYRNGNNMWNIHHEVHDILYCISFDNPVCKKLSVKS